MESTGKRTFRSWYVTCARLLKRGASYPHVIWLGRFYDLALYSVLKGSLLFAIGMLSMRASSLRPRPNPPLEPNVWVMVLLGILICTLLLIAGLVMASSNRPRA